MKTMLSVGIMPTLISMVPQYLPRDYGQGLSLTGPLPQQWTGLVLIASESPFRRQLRRTVEIVITSCKPCGYPSLLLNKLHNAFIKFQSKCNGLRLGSLCQQGVIMRSFNV